jgi:asparagine synthetase B (glutamine-hydrolysing)
MTELHRKKERDLTRCATDWQRTLVADFPDASPSARADAQEIARLRVGKARSWQFSPDDAAALVVESAWSTEDVSAVPTAPVWSLYREAHRAGLQISLEGHGAGALLGGSVTQLDWTMAQVNDALYREFHGPRLPAALRNLDRCSMAHGVEMRLPFLDWRLVAFVQALPATSKFGGGQTQRILRDALAGLVPDRVRRRRREPGFAPWLAGWRAPALQPLVAKLVNAPSWNDSPHWNGPQFRTLALQARPNPTAVDPSATRRLDTCLNLALWETLFVRRVDRRSLAS